MSQQKSDRQLLSDLIFLTQQSTANEYVCIKSSQEHGLKNVEINSLQMAILLEGEKKLQFDNQHLELEVGDILLIKSGGIFNVTNIPSPKTGKYLTLKLSLCEEAIQATRLLWGQPIVDRSQKILKFSMMEVAQPLAVWQQALTTNDFVQARMALTQLLLQICQQGFSDILLNQTPTLSQIIHHLVIKNPQYKWQSQDFEMQLGMSGATLRRKLAQEYTTLRQVIIKARLLYAMELLYATKLPLKAIASKSGYDSVAVFRQRFIEYYDVEPKLLVNY